MRPGGRRASPSTELWCGASSLHLLVIRLPDPAEGRVAAENVDDHPDGDVVDRPDDHERREADDRDRLPVARAKQVVEGDADCAGHGSRDRSRDEHDGPRHRHDGDDEGELAQVHGFLRSTGMRVVDSKRYPIHGKSQQNSVGEKYKNMAKSPIIISDGRSTDTNKHRQAGSNCLLIHNKTPAVLEFYCGAGNGVMMCHYWGSLRNSRDNSTGKAGGVRKAPRRGYAHFISSWSPSACRSCFSWSRTYCLIISSSSPTVDTKYPRLQKLFP